MYNRSMITSILYFVSGIVSLFQWLFWFPPTRVRRLELEDNSFHYVYGTVEKETHEPGPLGYGDHVAYWTVRWDDKPLMWDTRPSYQFVWESGEYTLLTK